MKPLFRRVAPTLRYGMDEIDHRRTSGWLIHSKSKTPQARN
jgi:hypothetical protein